MTATETVLINVNVIDMTAEEVARDRVVLVDRARIVSISDPDHVSAPTGAQVVDGQGGYLIPGLADMHSHLAFRDPDPAHLVLYLAEGVTTVRSLSGLPANAAWRREIEEDHLLGPNILTAGNVIVDGLAGVDPDRVAAAPVFIPSSPEEAAAEVRRQAGSFPDLVKVYDGLQEDHYLAAIAAANEAGIYVAGHMLDESSLETVLTSGIDEIAHVDELNYTHWVGTPDQPDFRMDYEAIPNTARLMVENGVAIVSNLVADEVIHQLIFDEAEVWSRPGYRVVRPELLERWKTQGRHREKFADQGPYRRDVEMPFFKALVLGLHQAGVLVTVGTDTSQDLEGSIPGNIHRELELLVEAGFSPFDALVAGTRNAGLVAERMGRDGEFGTIETGRRSDLLLLAGNPLEDIGHTRERLGIMIRGRWHPQEQLDRLVDEFVATY